MARFGAGLERALLDHAGELAVFDGELLPPQGGAVGDGDHTDTVFGNVDGVDGQLIGAAVIDLDRGVATGHAQLAIARADDGARDVDATGQGLDRIEHDELLVDVKEAIDRGQPIGTERNAGAHVALGVGKVDRGGGCKVLGNMELDRVNAALYEAVDVQIAGIDIDRTHRKDDGLAVFLVAGRHPVVAAVQAAARRDLQEVGARAGHIKVQSLVSLHFAGTAHGDLVGVHQFHAPNTASGRHVHGHADAAGVGNFELVKVDIGRAAQASVDGTAVGQLLGGGQAVVGFRLGAAGRQVAINGLVQARQTRVVLSQAQLAGLTLAVVEQLTILLVEVQVLARVLVGMEPVVRAEVEVTCSAELDRLGAQLAGHVDAALQVAQRQIAVGVVDLAAHIQVLWCVGDVDAQVVVVLGVSVLQDLDLAGTARTGRSQVRAVEVGGAGLQGLELTRHDVLAARIEHRDVAHHQAQRRVVDHVDLGRAMGHKALGCDRFLHGGLAVRGADEDAAA